MTSKSVDVFALRDTVVDEYRRFATSFTKIRAPDIREQVQRYYDDSRYWPEPLIQINPSYREGADINRLVAEGMLDPGCADELNRNRERHGDHRTKRVILEIYDAMTEAARTGRPYQTRLDPPPADPRVAHAASTRPDWATKGHTHGQG